GEREQDREQRADPAPAHFCSFRVSPAIRICGSTSGFSAWSSATGMPVLWAIEVSVSPLCTVYVFAFVRGFFCCSACGWFFCPDLLSEFEFKCVFEATTTIATIAPASAARARILAIQLRFLFIGRGCRADGGRQVGAASYPASGSGAGKKLAPGSGVRRHRPEGRAQLLGGGGRVLGTGDTARGGNDRPRGPRREGGAEQRRVAALGADAGQEKDRARHQFAQAGDVP